MTNILFHSHVVVMISQVPQEIPAWKAAFIEPLACSIHGVERGDIQFGHVSVLLYSHFLFVMSCRFNCYTVQRVWCFVFAKVNSSLNVLFYTVPLSLLGLF